METFSLFLYNLGRDLAREGACRHDDGGCSERATDGRATFTSSLAIRSPHNTLQGGSDQQHLQEPHNKETCSKTPPFKDMYRVEQK